MSDKLFIEQDNIQIDRPYVTELIRNIDNCYNEIDFQVIQDEIKGFLANFKPILDLFSSISLKRVHASSPQNSNTFNKFIKAGKFFSELEIKDYLSFRTLDLILFIVSFQKQGETRLKLLKNYFRSTKDTQKIQNIITKMMALLDDDHVLLFLNYITRILSMSVLRDNMTHLLNNSLESLKEEKIKLNGRINTSFVTKNVLTILIASKTGVNILIK